MKGEAAIWAEAGEIRTALLAKIVADADRLVELSRQAQGELPEDGEERQRIVAAAELLGQLLRQDVERAEGGVGLKDGVSRDRMTSVHDPEMRHGHKSSSRRFDGHKAAIVVDTDSQLITAVEVLPGNAPDNLGALELVEASEANTGVPVAEAMGDAAYGDGDTRQTFADAGRTLIAGAGASQPDPLSERGLPYRPGGGHLHLSGGECPDDGAGGTAHRPNGSDLPFRPSDSTRRSAGYAPCGPSAWRQNRVRDERCNCTRRKRQQARALQQSEAFAEYRQRRVVVEHRLARLVQGIRRATSGKPGSSCTAATVANLTLVAAKAGLTGETGSGQTAAPRSLDGQLRHRMARAPSPCSYRPPKSLFPIKGFPSGFLGLHRTGRSDWRSLSDGRRSRNQHSGSSACNETGRLAVPTETATPPREPRPRR